MGVDFGRIGGAYNLDWYLSECKEKKDNNNIDLIYIIRSTSHINSQWLKMWARVSNLYRHTFFWNTVIRINNALPGYEKYLIPRHGVYLSSQDKVLSDSEFLQKKSAVNSRLKTVLNNNRSNIFFTKEERSRGCDALRKMGVPNNMKYICFHSRDSAYLDRVKSESDWSYHDYRDSDIKNYLPAAESMTDRGYYAIRMGAIVKHKISANHNNGRIIDYASTKHRTDFNDVYIGSNCHFFLCSDGGMSVFPEMFRLPVVYVNWTIIKYISTWTSNGLFIFKKFYLKNEDRFMTFSEIINTDFGGPDTQKIFNKLDIVLIENTSEEIRDVTIEMDQRLGNIWNTTREDEELQSKFWSLFEKGKLKSNDLRIGSKFLRNNQDLLIK
jgi:putative glycosyltransferase (TIGR04372 family)